MFRVGLLVPGETTAVSNEREREREKREKDRWEGYLAVGVDDGQERNDLEGHVGFVHSPVLIACNKIKKKTSRREKKKGSPRLVPQALGLFSIKEIGTYDVEWGPCGAGVGEDATGVGSCEMDGEVGVGVLEVVGCDEFRVFFRVEVEWLHVFDVERNVVRCLVGVLSLSLPCAWNVGEEREEEQNVSLVLIYIPVDTRFTVSLLNESSTINVLPSATSFLLPSQCQGPINHRGIFRANVWWRWESNILLQM